MPKPPVASLASPRAAALLVVYVGALVALPLLAQDGLDKREVKRMLKQAEETLARGHAEAAHQLYLDLAASVAAGDERRADVLYGLALSSALTAGSSEDLAAMEDVLKESAALPSALHRSERAALGRLVETLTDLAAQRAENKRLSDAATDLELELAELGEQRRRSAAASQQEAGERSELETQLQAATENIAKLTAELETTRAELASKERTLERLRKKLVGDG